jgi:hypothetical protein
MSFLIDTRRPTKRAPDAGDSGAIPSLFLRLSIFPIGRRPAARPSAGNANRFGGRCAPAKTPESAQLHRAAGAAPSASDATDPLASLAGS